MRNDLQFLNGGGSKIGKLGRAKIGKQGKGIGKILGVAILRNGKINQPREKK